MSNFKSYNIRLINREEVVDDYSNNSSSCNFYHFDIYDSMLFALLWVLWHE